LLVGNALGRPVILTRHAHERLMRLGFSHSDVLRALREGERIAEGRSRARYRLRTKRGVLVVITREFPEEVFVTTVTRGKEKGR